MPPLDPGDVHLWWIDLAGGQDDTSLLSLAERERAGRLRRVDDRRRWVAARTALRQILGGYLGLPPRDVPLAAGAQGKPALAGGTPRFNLSHAGERALLAVALSEVGVDLECVAGWHAMPADLAGLVAKVCTAEEAKCLWALPEGDRRLAFFRLWVLKEAYLKGIGVGLKREMRLADFHHQPLFGACPQALLPLPSGEDPIGREEEAGDQFVMAQAPDWTLRLLEIDAGWVAALAVPGQVMRLFRRDWPAEATDVG